MVVKIPCNASEKILKLDLKELRHKNIANEYLYGKVTVNGNVLSDNVFFFSKHKDLSFPKSKLEVKVIDQDVKDSGEYTLKVSCSSNLYTRLTELKVIPVVLNQTPSYSDNFFDIQPNETKEIEIRGKFLKGQRVITLALSSVNAEHVKPISISLI